MSNKTRIYAVLNDDGSYLIRATSKSQAIGHVARNLFACRVASQEELVALLAAGIQITDASTGSDNEVNNEKTNV